jgi:glycerol-3-phosphate dehydrogenase (NAD(P)+)
LLKRLDCRHEYKWLSKLSIFNKKPIVVFGSGSYGTALALNFYLSQKNVVLLPSRLEDAQALIASQKNNAYLPDVPLGNLPIANDYSVLSNASAILLVVPTTALETLMPVLKPYLNKEAPLIICAKGILPTEPFLLSAYLEGVVENPIGIWSGPHFAKEAAQQVLSALTLACNNQPLCQDLIYKLSTKSMRLYGTLDVISVQIAGALKNVVAIACGIARGLGYGENTIAALITRGLSEIKRLAVAMGGEADTLLGLCGVGDLTLTCNSLNSRNTSLGVAIAKGGQIEEILSDLNSVAEGYYTTKAAYKLTQTYNVRMPIVQCIYEILYEKVNLHNALHKLLSHHATWEYV